MDQSAGLRKSGRLEPGHADHGKDAGILGAYRGRSITRGFGGDEGAVSRYFPQFLPDEEPYIYDAKANRLERHAGGRNPNPCVKPGATRPNGLLRKLWRLILPPSEVGIDCFAGSGSGPAAAAAEGLRCIGIEIDPGCVEYAHKRIPELLRLAELHARGVTPEKRPATPSGQGQIDLFDLLGGPR